MLQIGTTTTQALFGLSLGYNYTFAVTKEEETRQGKNYYQSSAFQAMQISQLGSIGEKLSHLILQNGFPKVGASLAISGTTLAGCVVCPMVAAARQGHLKQMLPTLKRHLPDMINFLPDELDKETEAWVGSLSEHLGTISKISMVAGTIALSTIGSPYLASGLLVPVVFQAVDSRGWVPRKISLVAEEILPTVATSGVFLGGGLISQGLGVTQILSSYAPFTQLIHNKIDKLCNKYFKLTGPTIEDIEAPVVVNRHLTFAQINAILDVDPHKTSRINFGNGEELSKFKVNPAHCSKRTWVQRDLPKNFELSKLLDLFKSIEWKDKYSLIKKPFFEDDNFFFFLKDCFKHVDEKVIKAQIEFYFDKHIDALNVLIYDEDKEITKEKFLADRLEVQMKILVQVLTGERRAKGSQRDVEESIQFCAQILDYLLKLNPEIPHEKVILEDILLKLAIEGGDYCSRGIRRASDEIVTGILIQLAGEDEDPLKAYENRLQFTLEQERKNIVNELYQGLIKLLVLSAKGKSIDDVADADAASVAEDIHTYDFYRRALLRGLAPLPENDPFTISDLYNWELLKEIHEKLYLQYYLRIDCVFKEVGHAKFGEYINKIINQNHSLTEGEKEEVLGKLYGVWCEESTQCRFNRLVCVILGILNFEESIQAWEKIDSSSLPSIGQNDWIVVNKS